MVCYNDYIAPNLSGAVGIIALCGSQPCGRSNVMKNSEKTLDMIVNLCKNRGFIYPGSEIYGCLANSWDY